jgi:hypothetical protein
MDILEQKRDRVKAMKKGKCPLISVREEGRIAWYCKRNSTTSSCKKVLGQGIPFLAAVLPLVTPCLLVSCTPLHNIRYGICLKPHEKRLGPFNFFLVLLYIHEPSKIVSFVSNVSLVTLVSEQTCQNTAIASSSMNHFLPPRRPDPSQNSTITPSTTILG